MRILSGPTQGGIMRPGLRKLIIMTMRSTVLIGILSIAMLVFASCSLPGADSALVDAAIVEASSKSFSDLIVTLDADGGIVDPPIIIVKHGKPYDSLPTPTRTGYAFGGWWTDPSGGGSLVTSDTKVSSKQAHTLYARWNQTPEKIVGTAATGTECFFLDFDVTGSDRDLTVLLPASPEGYVKDGKLEYEALHYPVSGLYFDIATGFVVGSTVSVSGKSYSFSGMYSAAEGFIGNIRKNVNGIVSEGIMVGKPVFSGMNVVNYVGMALYQFATPTPQVLLFNTAINFDTKEVTGTWAESGEGWSYSLHGNIEGSTDKKSITINATPLEAFEPYLLYDLNVLGNGIFKNNKQIDIAGTLAIQYGESVLPSLLAATKAPD